MRQPLLKPVTGDCHCFKFEVDAAGRNFVTMAHDEATKNHPGRASDIPSTEKMARMYETPEENYGYKALNFYQTKLNPECDAFFQYPKKKWNYDDEVWYKARPIGVNKLDVMMKSTSEAAKLSNIYTNHSVRATAITLWSNAGVQNRHMLVSTAFGLLCLFDKITRQCETIHCEEEQVGYSMS